MKTILQPLVKTYTRCLDKRPTLTMCLTTATLHAAGDLIAQHVIEKKEVWDKTRTSRFFFLGLVWDGPLLSAWYRFLSRAIPKTTTITTAFKVSLDQFCFIPGMLGSFLILNASLQRMDLSEIKQILERDYFKCLMANYQLWPMAMAFNFYLMPLKHQVLFTNSVSVVWNTYLSWRANKKLTKEDQEQKTVMNNSVNKDIKPIEENEEEVLHTDNTSATHKLHTDFTSATLEIHAETAPLLVNTSSSNANDRTNESSHLSNPKLSSSYNQVPHLLAKPFVLFVR